MCGRRQDKKGVEAYLEKHGINAALQEAMTASVKVQCPNAKAHIGASLIGLSGLNVPGLVPALQKLAMEPVADPLKFLLQELHGREMVGFTATVGANEPDLVGQYTQKMKADGCSETAIKAFLYNFEKLTSGANLMIPESALSAVDSLPSYDTLVAEDSALLGKTVMLKLNGGLGTGMGLEKAKSLLPLKGDDTFLDFIAKQVAHMRQTTGVDLAFMLMNSFATSADTLEYLSKYPLATQGLPLEFQQNKARRRPPPRADWLRSPSLAHSAPGRRLMRRREILGLLPADDCCSRQVPRSRALGGPPTRLSAARRRPR